MIPRERKRLACYPRAQDASVPSTSGIDSLVSAAAIPATGDETCVSGSQPDDQKLYFGAISLYRDPLALVILPKFEFRKVGLVRPKVQTEGVLPHVAVHQRMRLIVRRIGAHIES